MEALREVTVWDVEYRQPNHIYLFDGEKAVAYIKWGEGEPEYFKNPSRIDRRGRKFVPADIGLFKIPDTSKNIVKIQGSNGRVYSLDKTEKTCSCPGFQYRGACKHVAEIG